MLIGFKAIIMLVAVGGAVNPPATVTLGSGHRGLVFTRLSITNPKLPPYTVAIACNINPGYFLSAGFSEESPNSQILARETFTQSYVNSFPPNYWSGGVTKNLYSFGDEEAFDGRDLYKLEDGHIKIFPRLAQKVAKERYSLQKNHVFLGSFEGRIYFWIKNDPHSIYFKSSGDIYRFKLHSRVVEPVGMSKGDPVGDIALRAVVRPASKLYPSPRTFEWIVLNIKDAKLVK